ncbi:MAG: tetratricopeptide repeat protein [Porticoccaceae bacterium]|nr:tetratricopeptide repeat protein [Pseudomonadales bacterium]MCP5172725.1 tetratricopeptide repeat protein [Pseudomonadales bacterium]MCP5302199.1 tetratricopeptide repeat protein [Pseudomonadales bacterium]
MHLYKSLIAVVILITSGFILAAESDQEAIVYLQKHWAENNYQMSGKLQKEAFVALIEEADKLVSQFPESAGVFIWRGIIESTYAGVKGGLSALKYAKAAKADLEKALELDANALDGSAYTSLGTLYFNVPGWPLGFGDDDKAEELLKKALSINPDGLDPNYFYADYLRKEGQYKEAENYFKKALKAEPRPGREVADQGRRAEINAALIDIARHLR